MVEGKAGGRESVKGLAGLNAIYCREREMRDGILVVKGDEMPCRVVKSSRNSVEKLRGELWTERTSAIRRLEPFVISGGWVAKWGQSGRRKLGWPGWPGAGQ